MVDRTPGIIAYFRNRAALVVVVAAALLLVLGAVELVRSSARAADRAREVYGAIGATIEPLDAATARSLGVDQRGLVVTSVAKNGPAGMAGIGAGDVIERLGARPVESVGDVASALRESHGAIDLTLNRHRHYAIVQLQMAPSAGRSSDRERGTQDDQENPGR